MKLEEFYWSIAMFVCTLPDMFVEKTLISRADEEKLSFKQPLQFLDPPGSTRLPFWKTIENSENFIETYFFSIYVDAWLVWSANRFLFLYAFC